MIPRFIQEAIDEKLDHLRNIADHYAKQAAYHQAATCINAYAITVSTPRIPPTHLIMTSYPGRD